MPDKTDRLSWLSPKRRRTTGNLKTLPNAHRRTESDDNPPLSPTKETLSDEHLSPSFPLSRTAMPFSSRVTEESTRPEQNLKNMTEAMERTTQGVERLAGDSIEKEQILNDRRNGDVEEDSLNELSGHLWRMGDMLTRNLDHVEGLAKRQIENEEKLRVTLEDISARQRADPLDASQLSAHLDRIQRMMEQSTEARSKINDLENPLTVDFAPLTEHLKSLQISVEENSALMKKLLHDYPDATKTTARRQVENIDPSPLTEQFQTIETILQTQNTHLESIIQAQTATKLAIENVTDFSALTEPIQAFCSAIEQAPQVINNGPLETHLEVIREVMSSSAAHMQELVQAQKPQPPTPDLPTIKGSQHDPTRTTGDPKFLLAVLSSHLSQIQSVVDQNASAVKSLTAFVSPNSNLQIAEAERMNGMVRELMGTMKALTDTILEERKGCGHVIFPPPRKMGRKVVGFVYDGKDGG